MGSSRRSLSCCRSAIYNFVNADWPLIILKALLANVDELDRNLSQNLIVS